MRYPGLWWHMLPCAIVPALVVVADGAQAGHVKSGQYVLEDSPISPQSLSPDRASRLSSMPSEAPSSPELLDGFPMHDLGDALATMQDHYFDIGLAQWPTGIDWTAAVMNTHMTGFLSSLSNSRNKTTSEKAAYIDNEISRYFAQSTAFFYGENAFEIRMQAYDDMLWVVLEWLDSIKFIEARSAVTTGEKTSDWYGQQFVPQFAHRARIFYELAEQGWDWCLCGGGMTWNPRLLPYKNAITNQLFISASISMYLHFPGDGNDSPFASAEDDMRDRAEHRDDCNEETRLDGGRYNPLYRKNAINGYKWLNNSGMLNKKGLYTDGFHIRDYSRNKSATTCNERNEMVYTYNQGVILSGLRGLWEATGDTAYLDDAYTLIENVIHATGWDMEGQNIVDDQGHWHGLGSAGILTELCDPGGSCSQDGQTFKGIFFHHLTAFCEPLPHTAVKPGKTFHAPGPVFERHERRCGDYASWVVHNARAALETRDRKGRFGSWWGASREPRNEGDDQLVVRLPIGARDYRNFGSESPVSEHPRARRAENQKPLPEFVEERTRKEWQYPNATPASSGDPNDRGRGRTLETQGSGVAVVRAMGEFLRWRAQRM